jgi:hypothetical protein
MIWRVICTDMQNINDEIRSHTEAFASTLTALVRQAALESVSAALGGSSTVAAPAQVAGKRGRGRPKKVAQATPATKAVAAAPATKAAAATPATKTVAAVKPVKGPASKKPAFGEKRPPAELAKLTERLGEYIKAHPGLRIESIGKALSTPTKELSLPVKKLLAGKRIRSEGQKRATEYFAA